MMMPQPCAVCLTHRPFEMSNVIPGLCGHCAQQRIVKVAHNPKPFGDGTTQFWQLAGMAQQGTPILKATKRAWEIR